LRSQASKEIGAKDLELSALKQQVLLWGVQMFFY
jgi:hypothetical protein